MSQGDEGGGTHAEPRPLTCRGQAMQAPGPGHVSLLFPAPVPHQLGHFVLVEPLRSPDALLVQMLPDRGGRGHPQPLQDPFFDGFQLEPVPVPRVWPRLRAGEKQQELEAGEGSPDIPQRPRHGAGGRCSPGGIYLQNLLRKGGTCSSWRCCQGNE